MTDRPSPIFLSAARLIGCVLGAVMAAPGHATDTDPAPRIEEIVVTAEFRGTDLDAFAGSATVVRPNVDGTTVQHLEEVLARAPNVNFASGASRARFIQIRGIGERGQFSEPLNSSVALLVDGVDMSGIGTAATLFDVAQVEVLKGPQGTLYGANALAGLINLVTHDPTPEHIGEVRLDAGNYDALGAGLIVSGPLTPQLGYRISGQRYRDNGFVDNVYLRKEDTSDHDEGSYRAKLVWQSDVTMAELVAGRIDIENGYDAFSLDNDRNMRSDEPGADRQDTDYAAVKIEHSMGPSVLLQTHYGYARSDIDYGYDEDWAYVGFHPFEYQSTDRYIRQRTTHSLDVRLLSEPGRGLADGRWDWLTGLYHLRQDVDLRRLYTYLPADFESRYDLQRWALYGEVSRPLGEEWRVTLGLRYETHAADYNDNDDVDFSPRDDLFGGRVLVERTLAQGALVYAALTQGYKAGGFNTDGSLVADLREYDPETLWNLEVGLKARWLDERLRLRGALFYMHRDDIQTSTSIERPVDDSGAVEFIVYTGNAAQGFNRGVEVELEYLAGESLTLFVNAGWLDTAFEDYIDNNGRDLDGRDQAHAPNYQYFAGARWDIAPSWAVQIELEGKDGFYYSNSHAERADSYRRLNASLEYRGQQFSARLWGRNLNDTDHGVRGFYFGNDPRELYAPRSYVQLAEPRRVGLTVTFNW